MRNVRRKKTKTMVVGTAGIGKTFTSKAQTEMQEKLEMLDKEQTKYVRIALGMSGIVVNDITSEMIWRTIEKVQTFKGDFTLRDAVDIEVLVTGKYVPKEVSVKHNKPKQVKKENKITPHKR